MNTLWNGTGTTDLMTLAETIHNKSLSEQRQQRIAKWVTDSAIKKAKEQIKFRELVLKESNHGKAL